MFRKKVISLIHPKIAEYLANFNRLVEVLGKGHETQIRIVLPLGMSEDDWQEAVNQADKLEELCMICRLSGKGYNPYRRAVKLMPPHIAKQLEEIKAHPDRAITELGRLHRMLPDHMVSDEVKSRLSILLRERLNVATTVEDCLTLDRQNYGVIFSGLILSKAMKIANSDKDYILIAQRWKKETEAIKKLHELINQPASAVA